MSNKKLALFLACCAAAGITASCNESVEWKASECENGAKSCINNAVNECKGGEWTVSVQCEGATPYCNSADYTCTGTAPVTCTEGQARCEDNVLKVCSNNAWTSTPCNDKVCDAVNKTCDDNVPACVAGCKDGKNVTCNADGEAVVDDCSYGCNEAGTACAEAKKCKDADNVEYNDGDKICKTETQITECKNGEWVDVNTECSGDTPVCDDGACVAEVPLRCNPYTKDDGTPVQLKDGETMCDNEVLVSCTITDGVAGDATSKDCTLGESGERLVGVTCGADPNDATKFACVPLAPQKDCEEGEVKCEAVEGVDTMFSCGTDNQWVKGDACETGKICGTVKDSNDNDVAACVDDPNAKCTEGAKKCDGDLIATCDAEGAWGTAVACENAGEVCVEDATDGAKCAAPAKCTVGTGSDAVEYSHGDKICTSDTEISECVNGVVTLLNTTCSGDKPVCDDGECVECVNDDTKCVAVKDDTTGVYTHTLYTCADNAWGTGAACEDDKVCDTAEPSKECKDVNDLLDCSDGAETCQIVYGDTYAVGCMFGGVAVATNCTKENMTCSLTIEDGTCESGSTCTGEGRILDNSGDCVCDASNDYILDAYFDECVKGCRGDAQRCFNDGYGDVVQACDIEDGETLGFWEGSSYCQTGEKCRDTDDIYFCAAECESGDKSCTTIDNVGYALVCDSDGNYKISETCSNGCNTENDGCEVAGPAVTKYTTIKSIKDAFDTIKAAGDDGLTAEYDVNAVITAVKGKTNLFFQDGDAVSSSEAAGLYLYNASGSPSDASTFAVGDNVKITATSAKVYNGQLELISATVEINSDANDTATAIDITDISTIIESGTEAKSDKNLMLVTLKDVTSSSDGKTLSDGTNVINVSTYIYNKSSGSGANKVYELNTALSDTQFKYDVTGIVNFNYQNENLELANNVAPRSLKDIVAVGCVDSEATFTAATETTEAKCEKAAPEVCTEANKDTFCAATIDALTTNKEKAVAACDGDACTFTCSEGTKISTGCLICGEHMVVDGESCKCDADNHYVADGTTCKLVECKAEDGKKYDSTGVACECDADNHYTGDGTTCTLVECKAEDGKKYDSTGLACVCDADNHYTGDGTTCTLVDCTAEGYQYDSTGVACECATGYTAVENSNPLECKKDADPNACDSNVDTYRCEAGVRQECMSNVWTDSACPSATGATVTCDATAVAYCKIECNASEHYVADGNGCKLVECGTGEKYAADDISCECDAGNSYYGTVGSCVQCLASDNKEWNGTACVCAENFVEGEGGACVAKCTDNVCANGQIQTCGPDGKLSAAVACSGSDVNGVYDCADTTSCATTPSSCQPGYHLNGNACVQDCEEKSEFVGCNGTKKSIKSVAADCTESTDDVECASGSVCDANASATDYCVAAASVLKCSDPDGDVNAERCDNGKMLTCTANADSTAATWADATECKYGCNTDNTACAAEAWCTSSELHCGEVPANANASEWKCNSSDKCELVCNDGYQLDANGACVAITCGGVKDGTSVEVLYNHIGCTADNKYFLCGVDDAPSACGTNEYCNPAAGEGLDAIDYACVQCLKNEQCNNGGYAGICNVDHTCSVDSTKCDANHVMNPDDSSCVECLNDTHCAGLNDDDAAAAHEVAYCDTTNHSCEYKCAEGFVLDGSDCVSECSNGKVPNADGVCVESNCTDAQYVDYCDNNAIKSCVGGLIVSTPCAYGCSADDDATTPDSCTTTCDHTNYNTWCNGDNLVSCSDDDELSAVACGEGFCDNDLAVCVCDSDTDCATGYKCDTDEMVCVEMLYTESDPFVLKMNDATVINTTNFTKTGGSGYSYSDVWTGKPDTDYENISFKGSWQINNKLVALNNKTGADTDRAYFEVTGLNGIGKIEIDAIGWDNQSQLAYYTVVAGGKEVAKVIDLSSNKDISRKDQNAISVMDPKATSFKLEVFGNKEKDDNGNGRIKMNSISWTEYSEAK